MVKQNHFPFEVPPRNIQVLCMLASKEATFEILEVIDNMDSLKDKETELIKQFIGNPLLINRAYDAHSNKGIKWTQEEKDKTKNGLIEKYKKGLLKTGIHKPGYKRTTRKAEDLFKSKIFGDKE